MPELAYRKEATVAPSPLPEDTAPVPVPHLAHTSVADAIAELRVLIAATPGPVSRPMRDDDPPSPRTWNYRKQPVPFRHLVVRFLRSMQPGRPSDRSVAWARGLLSAAEWPYFEAQPGFDQRHAIGVAKVVLDLTDNPLAARAALLHDVGKVDCRLDPVGRSLATVFRMLFPHLSDRWSRAWWIRLSRSGETRLRPRGLSQRFASYWMHPWVGRRMLDASGADHDVGAWALYHHHWFLAEDLPFSWDEALALWFADGD